MGQKSAKSPPGRLPPRDNCLAPAVGHAASVAVRGGDQCFDNLFIAIERIEELARDLGTNAGTAMMRLLDGSDSEKGNDRRLVRAL